MRFGRRRKSGESARERLEVGADRGELYRAHVQEKLASGDDDEAMRQAIGGEFDAIGAMQCDLLVAHGLQPDGTVVDVGCGSGRLALPLSRYLDERGSPDAEKPLDQFLSRDALASFAHHLELETVAVLDGDRPTIPLRQPVTMENGTAYTDLGALGQSIAVFGLPERAGRLEA